jgi:uncharacterized iron-regulated membrane protein
LIGNLARFVLGITATSLLVMVVTGAYLWWPGVRKLALAFKLRLGKNRYIVHNDLHKIIGFAALPFLLIWALTGLYFEYYDQFRLVWYGITFTEAPAEPAEITSMPNGQPPLTADATGQRAVAAVPGATLISVSMPIDDTGVYSVWVQRGTDPYAYSAWPGNIDLQIDQYSGQVLHNGLNRIHNASTMIFEGWLFGLHTGWFADWRVRLVWIGFGLAPLALAVTGMSMWWMKRRAWRRRQLAAPTTAIPRTTAQAPRVQPDDLEQERGG